MACGCKQIMNIIATPQLPAFLDQYLNYFSKSWFPFLNAVTKTSVKIETVGLSYWLCYGSRGSKKCKCLFFNRNSSG